LTDDSVALGLAVGRVCGAGPMLCLVFYIYRHIGNGGGANAQTARLLYLEHRMELVTGFSIFGEPVFEVAYIFVGKLCPNRFNFVLHICRFYLRYFINAATARFAPQKPLYGLFAPFPKPVFSKSHLCIMRTTWVEHTAVAQTVRNVFLIKPDEAHGQP
jgi:hypothetical protein